MKGRRVLLLAGSTEATAVARLLAAEQPDMAIAVSFAGRTSTRAALPASVTERVGGFGGVTGLSSYLIAQRIYAVIDATHPFARQMPFHAEAACAAVRVPLLRVVRPPWASQAGDQWLHASDMRAAAQAVRHSSAMRVLLTIGRQELAPFGQCPQRLLARCIDLPEVDVLPAAEILLARGPFTMDDELELLRRREIDLMVAKNSGGCATRAKVDAARELGIPIVMVARPAATDGETVATAPEALDWLQR